MPELYVGVDAGGSVTTAALACGERVLRTHSGGAANPNALGVDAALGEIARVVEVLLAGERAHAIAVGAAGAGSEATSRSLAAGLTARFPGARIAVTDDAHVALRAAAPHGDALALIAGTGSIACAEIGVHRVRVGGYGAAIGDEGCGHAIGAAALRALLRAYEAGTSLGPMHVALAEHLGVSTARGVLDSVYAGISAVATVAACAPVVLRCADAGDRAATTIVQRAALALFELLRALIAACRTQAGAFSEHEELPLALSGGLLRENGTLSYLLETRIANEYPWLRIVKGVPPYLGALAQARALR